MTPEYQPPPPPPPPPQRSRALRWIVGGCAVLLLGAIVIGAAGFAFYRWRSARTANNNRGQEESSGNPQSPVASPERGESNNANSNQSASTGDEGTRSGWETTASELGNEDGKTFTFNCTSNGSAHSVWGSDIYTADSSICTAGVHAGLVTFERGGSVTIELRPGRPFYGTSERNGVTTSVYGPYGRSFVFKSENAGSGNNEAEDVIPILWNTSTSMLTYEAGKLYKFKCPGAGKPNNIWGTDVYTADSSICTAAVHVGILKFEPGGLVTIELRPGEKSYEGTTKNGVTSRGYGDYAHSFVVR